MAPGEWKRFDEAAALEAYKQGLKEQAAKQDLSDDLRPQIRNLSIAFTVIGAVFVALRFIARKKQRVKIGIDDWLMLAALVLLVGNCIFNMVLIHQGVGLHSGSLTLDELQVLDETLVGAEIVYVTGVNMYKISLLYLYQRIFPVRGIRIGGYICGGISTAWMVACILAATFQCTPREKIWKQWLPGTCIDLFLTQLCISIPSILCDIAILALPIPHVWRLKTNLTQRIVICLIFLLGSYVVFTSIYRFVVYLDYKRSDVPYTLAMPIAWNVIEISSGVVSACLPTLAPLVRIVLKSISPSSGSRSNGNSASGAVAMRTIGGGGQPSGSRRSRAWDKMSDESQHIADDRNPDLVPSKSRGGVKVAVAFSRDRTADDSSNDEVPLTGIQRQTQVEWKVESNPDHRGDEHA